MRHPYKFSRALGVSYGITFGIDLSMGIIGYLMFGKYVFEEVWIKLSTTWLEITQSILGTPGYPHMLNYLVVAIISLIPITKMPLNTRPISTTLDILLGLSPISITSASTLSPLRRGLYRALIRIVTIALPVLIAIVFPEFDRIIALMGSGMCIGICVILPICYYFKILGHEIQLAERILCWIILIIGVICAIVGTVWTYPLFPFNPIKLKFRFLPEWILETFVHTSWTLDHRNCIVIFCYEIEHVTSSFLHFR
jgi:solute carrier family 32 (vesicular inhibitory amino acid transporter)